MNVPATLALPPLNVEFAKVCPYVITLAVGAIVTVGVPTDTVTV